MPETSLKVELPDGSELELEDGATGADAASAPLTGGERIEVITQKSPEALELVRHDAAHVLAEAVLDLWPGAKISIGPPIDNGFYYDIEFPDGEAPGPEDLERIEERMREHVAADERFERRELGTDEAIERFRAEGQDYKVELIEDLAREGAETVTLYRNGPFEDLCRGPHGPSTGHIGAFKLTSLAGAYWRGDETRQMLTRVYGTAFHDRRSLDRHLEMLEQARERDHRRLGPELDLFRFRPESPGMPFWLPKGSVLLELMQEEVRVQLRKRGYREIRTPEVLDEELWHRSGHWDNYKDNMYFMGSGDRRYALRPMNCPGACLVFRAERHSYRELPLRLAEFGKVFRNEREGVLHGLLRVRSFTQDDGHIYCAQDQIPGEVVDVLEAIDELYTRFGFADVQLELSTRPEKSIGTAEQWQRAEAALREALEGAGREYELNPGDGAFYGPKIDFHVTDALGRSWQLGTCQLDFSMPERFDLAYTGADNAEHTPVMIHRALLGSMERFAGILVEHHGGRLPLWLAPVQALVLPVADRHNDYAIEVAGELKRAGVRAEVDERSESVGRKIRDAELSKAPYMLVVGDREQEAGAISLRSHEGGDLGQLRPAELAGRIAAETG
jgi:threonyl-tRNA synthetase